MPRFFTDKPDGDVITVTGGDARHIGYSLRMKKGDRITFCNQGTDYLCVIESISESEVRCRVESREQCRSEPDIALTLYQALPKGDKLELITQKTTELGVARIVPFVSARCVARPDKKSAAKKTERLRRIAEEAAKQSGRGIIPEVTDITDFAGALRDMEGCTKKLFCYENGGERLTQKLLSGSGNIGVMIGSEGGFDRSEADAAVAAGAVKIWLGERILRCETCPIAVTAVIMNLTGNF